MYATSIRIHTERNISKGEMDTKKMNRKKSSSTYTENYSMRRICSHDGFITRKKYEGKKVAKILNILSHTSLVDHSLLSS
jgi:hypothetical protein